MAHSHSTTAWKPKLLPKLTSPSLGFSPTSLLFLLPSQPPCLPFLDWEKKKKCVWEGSPQGPPHFSHAREPKENRTTGGGECGQNQPRAPGIDTQPGNVHHTGGLTATPRQGLNFGLGLSQLLFWPHFLTGQWEC